MVVMVTDGGPWWFAR